MAKKHVKWSDDAVARFVKKATALRESFMERVNDLHVRLMPGNDKTGRNCMTVSLLPVVDCYNCKECKYHCYDLQHDVINKGCLEQRLINSTIHQADPERYWGEIEKEVKSQFVTELRINVGGDLRGYDFDFVNDLGIHVPACDSLFFTKNYCECNSWLDKHNGSFVDNVQCIYSRWPGMHMENPYHMPESHILWENGSTTAPAYGAYFCGGNCSYCHFYKEGCWKLNKNEHVLFKAH